MLRSTTLSISINRDPGTVYEFVLNPENLPRWAIMAFRSVKQRNNKWIAETPKGPTKVSHTKRNEFGILNHYVKISSGVDVFVPMHVVQNGNGSEMIFMVFQTTDMSEEKFAEDVVWLRKI